MKNFWTVHRDCEQPLKSWYREALRARWANVNELKKDYPSASILKNKRICFNIKGNNYRLIVKINFDYQIIWVRLIGTHSEYDKIDANNI